MFSFFKKKKPVEPERPADLPAEPSADLGGERPGIASEPPSEVSLNDELQAAAAAVTSELPSDELRDPSSDQPSTTPSTTRKGWLSRLWPLGGDTPAPDPAAARSPAVLTSSTDDPVTSKPVVPPLVANRDVTATPAPGAQPPAPSIPAANAASEPPGAHTAAAPAAHDDGAASAKPTADLTAPPEAVEASTPSARRGWLDKLRSGLRKTGTNITQVFTGTRIDDALYEELESALLMADTGLKAAEHLLRDLKRRVKDARATEASQVRALLAESIADLLTPLEGSVTVGEHSPTVIMVVGVNGAGKTTTIGKLTRHLADADQKVLLAAADTFRAAAREQLAVWAGRNRVEIVSQEGGDPSAVTFDAVSAGKARGCDVVIADTAGRLPTQLHLMEELKKIHRVIGKAQAGAPHEVLLVVDGNTGQNALAQVKSFDEALSLTGLVVTKLDGTAKGGVLAAIALWARERNAARPGARPLSVYFLGVGEQLDDLQTFKASEFAQALLS